MAAQEDGRLGPGEEARQHDDGVAVALRPGVQVAGAQRRVRELQPHPPLPARLPGRRRVRAVGVGQVGRVEHHGSWSGRREADLPVRDAASAARGSVARAAVSYAGTRRLLWGVEHGGASYRVCSDLYEGDPMTATDQLRAALHDLEAKVRELELEKKLEKFADQADHYLREAAVKAGDYAHDHRDRVEGTLDRAGAKVDEKTDGKYHRTFEKLKTGVLVGVDWVAEQRESPATPAWAEGTRWGSEPDAGGAPSPARRRPPARTLPSARPTRTPGSTSPTRPRRARLPPTRSDRRATGIPWGDGDDSHRTRHDGRRRGARRPVLGGPDPAQRRALRHRPRHVRVGSGGDPGARAAEEECGAREPRPRAARRRGLPGDRAGRRRGGAWRARRPLPTRRLPDRVGHAEQHERQRGHRQPGDRDPRGRARVEVAGAPQRRRQQEPVQQRHLPHRRARGRGARAGRAAAPGRRRAGGGAGAPRPPSSATSSRSGAPTCRTRHR